MDEGAAALKRRVVVTGMGAVCPLGKDIETIWQAALEGRSGIRPISLFDASTYPSRIAGQVPDWQPTPPSDPSITTYLNRSTEFLLCAANQATQQARLVDAHLDPHRTGVALGAHSHLAGLASLGRWFSERGSSSQPEQADLNQWNGRLSSSGTRLLARLCNLQGPALNLTTACAAGAQAIGAALRLIRRGEAELMLAGGHDAMVSEFPMLSFCLLRVLSTHNEAPAGASRPFDRLRDGFVMGEGAAVVVLESLEHAWQRGVPILAELSGYGTAMSAYRITDSPPDGEGAWQSMALALADAGVSVEEVDYINAHGTSTLDNDRTETAAIKRVFGKRAYQVPISSTKSMTGHLIGAAGALELIFAILSIRDSAVPPTINLENPDPECDLDYVPGKKRCLPVRTALSNSFGFGGHNAALAVRGWEA